MSTAHKSRDKKPCEPIAKSQPTSGSPKKSTIGGQKSTVTTRTNKVNPKQDKDSSHLQDNLKQRLTRNVSPTHEKGNLDNTQLADTTAYWNEQLQAQLLSRKKEVVDRFMAVIEECLDRKLEPFEEPCDGEGCAASSSHGLSKSSACKKGGSSKRQTIGKRREYQRDDDEGNESDNDNGGRRNDNNKRSKTTPEKDKLYACPYLKYAPDVFGKRRTCSGPGWHELHRLKEHLARSHKLPEFACPRCCERFAKEKDMNEHLREDEPCTKRQPLRSTIRNLADGYDKDQADLLKKRKTGPCQNKWISWYCILFDEDESSPNLPSPYQGVPANSNWSEGHTHRPRYGNYTAMLRRETLNLVRTLFETELDKALHGLRPQIRSNVLAQIPSVASSVQRIFQVDPELSRFSTTDGEASNIDIPPGFDPEQLFDQDSFLGSFDVLNSFDTTNFVQSDGFDFGLLSNHQQSQGQLYQPCMDSSSSYLSDDWNGTTQSSNTSVEENFSGESSKNQEQQSTMAVPQQTAFPMPNDSYAQSYY